MNADPFRLGEARSRDLADPLRGCRERFALPEDVVYLDGNSLGALPATAAAVVQDAVARQWGTDLIRSWNGNDWIGAPQRVGGKIARLLGAAPHEVVVADSVSVNLFKLLTALARRQPGRTAILTETGNFPTDVHVAQGAADLLGLRLQREPHAGLLERLGDRTAVLLLTHVHYRSGERYDMAAVEAAARVRGVPVLWDLSHSVGAVPLDLAGAGVRFAVGCGYKYLNGGPGAPAFLYAAADQHDALRPALQGWMGDARPFEFRDEYRPGAGMDRFLAGTPPILSLLALECGVDGFAGIDMHAVWDKSQALFDFLAALTAEHCPQLRLVTPTAADRRGSHASFAHPEAWPINNALIARGVVGDFRTPDVLRLGLTPLYTRFADVARAVEILSGILATDAWRRPEHTRAAKVT